jgi:lipopolysaccharide export system protein LptA
MMGYYSTCNNENKIQLGRYWVQAGVIINRKEFEIKADTLIVTNKDKSNGLYITGKFLKQKLSSEQLIYKPDW